MSDYDQNETKKSSALGQPRKLELKKTVETGQVRQSFAHGRSKMVTVEVRKKRTFASDSGGRVAEVKGGPSLGGGSARGDAGRDAGLTLHEKEKRVRVLQDARRAEEDRVLRAAMQQAQLELEAEERAKAEAEERAQAEAVAEAAALAERAEDATAPEPATTTAEPAASVERKPTEEPVLVAAKTPAARDAAKRPETTPVRPTSATPSEAKAQVLKGEEDDAESRGRVRRVVRTPGRAPVGGRRTDDARKGGRLHITEALSDSAERMRSLASVRRAREKEKLKHQINHAEPQKITRDVTIPETLTVQELANRMAERSTDVIKALMKMGVMATLNHVIDGDTAELLVVEFGHTPKRVSDADVEIGLKGELDQDEQLQSRPPVVTVMGHVDHGKTSLLDALRQTDVAAGEAGGITQHIGAYQVTIASGDRITFIDTPGHEAFTQMRARGARVTDIVILVVAADDGVMPQTVEAINHAKAANVPLIVAINKVDKADANPEKVKSELLQYGIQVEDMGGETLCVEVSAKKGTNLQKLIDAILLIAEFQDLRANPDRPAEGVVIETKVERGRGSVATVLVQRGTLRMGDIFVAGTESGRVRGLMDAAGANVASAGPSMPVEVLGLTATPAAGDEFVVVTTEARAREVAEFRRRRMRTARTTGARGTFEQMLSRIQQGEGKELPLIIKADVHGSTEAIVGALEKLGADDVKVNILHTGVGGINETDIGLARASNAVVIGFNVRANPQARELAKRDNVEIRYYSIIYELSDDIKKLLSGMLQPTLRENILGYADIREVFTITKVGKVAGCMVTEGLVKRGARVRLLRDDVVIHEGDLGQLKRFKDDVREVRSGYDCGISLANYQDIQVGDKIECFEIEQIAREL